MNMLQMPTNTTHINLWRKGIDQGDALNDMCEQALQHGCEYVMTIDDDTQPPTSAVLDLLRVLESSDKDVMACGGIYTTKTKPPEPIVYMGRGQGAHWSWKMGDIFPCWALGNGCLMIKTQIFKEMPKPWFKNLRNRHQMMQFPEIYADMADIVPEDVVVSPDLFFFAKLSRMGYKVLAHGGVLPIHWGSDGRSYWLPADTYPTRGVTLNGKKFGWVDPDFAITEEFADVT